MAVSNRFDFNLKLFEIIREACEGVGGGPLDGEQLKSYVLALNLVYQNLINIGIPLSLICYWTENISPSISVYNLSPSIIDIHSQVIKPTNGGSEIRLERYSYDRWNHIPNKEQRGRPTAFVAERQHDNLLIRLWPVPDRAYYLNMYVFLKPDDMYRYTDNIRIQSRYLPALIAGLRHQIAVMRELPLDKIMFFNQEYEKAVIAAQSEDRERVTMKLVPRVG